MNEGMKMLIRVNVNCSLLNWPFYLKQREGNKKKVWRKKKGADLLALVKILREHKNYEMATNHSPYCPGPNPLLENVLFESTLDFWLLNHINAAKVMSK